MAFAVHSDALEAARSLDTTLLVVCGALLAFWGFTGISIIDRFPHVLNPKWVWLSLCLSILTGVLGSLFSIRDRYNLAKSLLAQDPAGLRVYSHLSSTKTHVAGKRNPIGSICSFLQKGFLIAGLVLSTVALFQIEVSSLVG